MAKTIRKGLLYEEDLAKNTGSGSATASRTTSTGGSQTLTKLGAGDAWYFGNINNILFVDGVKYTTVQAAVTAANGTVPVYVPPGTYVGPTTWPDGTQIIGMGDSIVPPEVWSLFNGAPFNSFTSGAGSKKLVKFTYTASLTITDVSQLRVENVVLDFGGTGGLILDGVSGSRFDMSVVNAAVTAPAVQVKANATYASHNNRFVRLVTHGGNGGLKLQGVTNFVTESIFDDIHILASTQPSGTFTALDFNANCDSNVLHKVQFWYTTAVTTLRGVYFNSSSATATSGADGIYINWYDETGADFTGNSILVNPSNNNWFRTGVLHGSTPISITSWAGNSTFAWDRVGDAFPSATNQSLTVPAIKVDAGATGTPALYLQQAGTTRWQIYNGGSNELEFNNGAANLASLSSTGNFLPQTTGQDFGATGNRWDIIGQTVDLSGLISNYNGIATVSNGAPSEYAVVNLTAQTAAVGTTTLYAVPASGAGQYRISFNAKVTTVATVSSILGGTNGFQIVYTDQNDSVVVTTVAGHPFNSTTANLALNTTQAQYNGVLFVNAKASTNIQYSIDYTSVGATAMQYNLHIVLEKL